MNERMLDGRIIQSENEITSLRRILRRVIDNLSETLRSVIIQNMITDGLELSEIHVPGVRIDSIIIQIIAKEQELT